MGLLKFPTFYGLMPKVSPRNLQELTSQVANNCWLSETTLEPLNEPLFVEALPDALRQSIYLWRRGGATEWLSWLSDVDVRQGPIAEDQYSRIYYTDGTTLHMKLWSGGTKVEVSDVSMTPPKVPSVTKTLLFDPVDVKAYNGNTQLQYVGNTWDGSTLKLTYRVPGLGWIGSGPFPAVYWLQFPDGGGSDRFVPSTKSVGPQDDLYNQTVDLYDDYNPTTKIGLFQVSAMENLNFDSTWVPPSGVQLSEPPHDVVFTCSLNLDRSVTQYQCYKTSYVDAYGQESPLSDATGIVTWEPNERLRIDTHTSSRVRIYRSATGSVKADYFFVAELDPGVTYYIDTLIDANLNEVAPLIENPPIAMTGLVSLPGGFFAAFNGKDLYFSEPFLPYSWPTRYRLTMDFTIVGLAVSGNDLIVLTTGNPYYVSGAHPDILTQSKLAVEQSCVSKRSICYSEFYVCYASPDGLVTVTGGQVKVVTQNFYTRAQWQALSPQDCIGAVHDGRFMGWMPDTAIIFDFKEQKAVLSTTDQEAAGVYSDLENDQLYLIQGATITDWNAGANKLLATWRAKEFQSIQTPIFNSVKIIADSYTDTTFNIFSDDVLLWSHVVTSDVAFRIPKFSRSERWSISIDTKDIIAAVLTGTSMQELRR